MVDLSDARWRASSYSDPDGGNCVEVADGFPGVVPVRDSKDPARAPLVFAAHAWAAFVTLLGDGRPAFVCHSQLAVSGSMPWARASASTRWRNQVERPGRRAS
ncbi:DUF397 domain-containing protein [Streptomyces qinglanensis]|uniref:DUF397 domain-containing protein n=1 Tax=Streptomyces qinglanensis TaxID=943816 RepID=UPI00378B4798